MKRVLVTGSSGRIGQAVVQELRSRGHHVRGFDLVASPGVHEMVQGTLTDAAAVARSLEGIETLVHLAATPDDADFLRDIVPNNIIGVYHVLESARAAGVQRLILASSGQVVWYRRFRGPWPIEVDVPPTPRYWYAAGKLFLEGAGRSFAEQFDIQVLAVRLGWCPRTRGQVEEIAADPLNQDIYLSPGDAGRFFACAVESTWTDPFTIVYATSKPLKQMVYEMEATRKRIGYEPQEHWPQGIEVVVGKS